MAITQAQYDALRAKGVSDDQIERLYGGVEKVGIGEKAYNALIKEPIGAVLKVGYRGGQAVGGLALKGANAVSGGALDERARARGFDSLDDSISASLQKEHEIPLPGGVKVAPLTPGFKTVERVLGETGTAAATVASFAAAPGAAKAATKAPGFLRTVYEGAKQGLGFGAKYGAAFGASSGLENEETLGGAIGSGIEGAAIGAAGGAVLGGTVGAVAGPLAARAARKKELASIFKANPNDSRLAKYMTRGASEVVDPALNVPGVPPAKMVKDPIAAKAIGAGIDPADVALIKGVPQSERAVFQKMQDTAEAATRDRRAIARPSDFAGEAVVNQGQHLQSTINAEGKKLDTVAASLKGNFVDVPLQQFDDDVAHIGATVDDGAINFKGSDFDGLPETKLIQNVYKRLTTARDALDIHRAKRFIDNVVDYGKNAQGLTGDAQSLLKGWRKAIDAALDGQFPAYDAVNSKLSSALGALDELGNVMGAKFKVGRKFANLKAAAVARRLLSNSPSRGDLMAALDRLQKAAIEAGYKGDEDVLGRVIFSNLLEEMYGTQATTGLKGTIESAGKALGIGKDLATGNFGGAASKSAEKLLELFKGDPKDALRRLLQGQ